MGWKIKGNWYESCASEGHCSFYFGRDREEPCRQFVLFQIIEGQIDNVDVGGILVITVTDLFSRKAADVITKGGVGGIYISDTATEKQRKVLEPFFINNVLGFSLLRKALGVKYVKIDLSQDNNSYHIAMPYGECKTSLAIGADGNTPQRIENSPFSMFFSHVNICNTHFWKYSDFGRDWKYVNRSGALSEFDLQGE
jgi:hypothetical protein